VSASASDGQADPGRPAEEILFEILSYDWNRAVLQSLAAGGKRHQEIRAELGDAAPGERQIDATLRDLANLGVVRKGDHENDPWKVTELGRGALADLAELDRLMADDPDRAIETFNPTVAHPARRYNLFVTHVTNDFQPQAVVDAHEQMRRQGRSDFWMRDKDEVTELFDGLEILAPGVVPSIKWRPEPGPPDLDLRVVNTWAAVARKPH
jgi:DNA-binding HxlR family transcriptional regulator